MFAGSDPFSEVDGLILQAEEVINEQKITPPQQPATPVAVVPELPLAPQVAGPPLDTASDDDGAKPFDGSSVPPNGDGWYVAYHAVLPGAYYGV